MNNFKKFFKDTIYVSRVTKTNNKKLLIIIAVILTQFSALADILIILFFTYIITETVSINANLASILEVIFSKTYVLPIIIFFRYLLNYLQIMIIKNLELNVQKNLKIHLLREIFNKRNYSVADAYFYINSLTTHISFFYSSFAAFLNYFLQIFAFSIYLFFTNHELMISFVVGILILFYPIYFILKKARKFMHDSYIYGQDSNFEIQRVVDNMFLIKLLNKENEEIERFSSTLSKFNRSLYSNHKYGVINSYLPSFLTLFILSIVILFLRFSKIITLDLIGISLRLFQSLGNLSTSINQIINSHVHLEKFYELENSKPIIYKENYKFQENLKTENIIELDKVTFRYVNSNDKLFNEIDLTIKKNTHTLITGKNGSGKSTLLGLMGGVYYPEKGKVISYTKNIGFVGASPLIFTANLRENILYGNKNKIEDKEIISKLKLLKTFDENSNYDLNKIIDNKSLSSGQTQKIAFVRALLMRIDLLLLDESTSNLDEYSKNIIFEILKENKITIINSTHDPEKFEEVDCRLNIQIIGNSRKIEILDQ